MKQQFYELIELENALLSLHKNIQTIKKRKKIIEENIKEYIETKDLRNKTFVILNKKIKYSKHKTYQCYSLQYLEESLLKLLKDESFVSSIILYLKENRKTNISNEIKILDYNNE